MLREFTDPPLTTVRNPGMAQGQLAARKLLSLLRQEPVEERITFLDTQLAIRESCGAARAGSRSGVAPRAR